MSGINPTVRPFLTGRIFQEIFEGQNISLKKKKLRGGFSENITRQNISRAKKLDFTQPRNILSQNNIWGYEAKPGQAFPPPVSAHLIPFAVPSAHVFHTMSLWLSSLGVADDAWYRYTVHSLG